MGYEGFSKPLPLARMNPIIGNKNEFLVLLGLVVFVPMLYRARRKNEDALRKIQNKTNNTYAELPLDNASR